MVDLDAVRLLRPPPDGDPWQREVAFANLRALVGNYRAAGAERFVLSGVVEEVEELPRFYEALGTERLLVVLLLVDPALARARLARRHEADPDGLAWHLDRHDELAGILDRAGFEDLRLDVADRAPDDLAREVRRAAGWG